MGAATTSLYVGGPGESAAPAPAATFAHLPGATVRGSVLRGSAVVLATADTAEGRDLSFNASLFRLAPQQPPEQLCSGVVHASRPLVTADARVFVSRGSAGVAPSGGGRERMRVDALSIDEVDPWTGALRTIHTVSGYLAFLAGAYEREVIVYRVTPDGADLAAIDADSGAVRLIVPSLPPFARDFSIDERRGVLVFQGRHERDARTWTIERVDLRTGERARLHESASMNLVPHVLPDGRVAFNPGGRDGLMIPGTAGERGRFGEGSAAVRRPLGEGADWVQGISESGQWIAALHTVQGALPVPFVIDAASGRSAALRAPDGARIAIAGFLPSEGGAK